MLLIPSMLYSIDLSCRKDKVPKTENDNRMGTATQCKTQIAEAQKPVASREGRIKNDFILNKLGLRSINMTRIRSAPSIVLVDVNDK